jgi:hypothetical protein
VYVAFASAVVILNRCTSVIRSRDLGTPARELDWKFELEIVERLYHIFYSGILEYIMSLFAKRILPIFLKHFFIKLETPMSC